MTASASSVPPPWPADVMFTAGQLVKGKYLIQAKISSGAMGSVYRAFHTVLERTVAIKVQSLSPENMGAADPKEFIARFRREAQVAFDLVHNRIARTIDLDTHKGALFMAMDFIEGADLSEAMNKEGRFATLRALQVLRQLAEALAYAGAQGIVHRDIKPANIRLRNYQPGALPDVVVIDFGLAKPTLDRTTPQPVPPATGHDQHGEPHTQSGMIMGTYAYIAPEQISLQITSALRPSLPPLTKVDPRADLYAAGIIFYRMLAGRLPFEKKDYPLLQQHLNEAPPPLSGVPAQVSDLTLRLLAKHPADRCPDAVALIAAIDECVAALCPAAEPPWWQRRRAVLLGAAVFLPLLIAGALAWFWARPLLRPIDEVPAPAMASRDGHAPGPAQVSLDLLALGEMPALPAPRTSPPQSKRTSPPPVNPIKRRSAPPAGPPSAVPPPAAASDDQRLQGRLIDEVYVFTRPKKTKKAPGK